MKYQPSLKNIRKAVSAYPAFKKVASFEKLKEPNKSKTVVQAKEIGVFLSRVAGHDERDIANEFGYASDKSVSNVFRKAARNYKNDGLFAHAVEQIAEKLDISLE